MSDERDKGKGRAPERSPRPFNPYLGRFIVRLGERQLLSLQRAIPALVEAILNGDGVHGYHLMIVNHFIDNSKEFEALCSLVSLGGHSAPLDVMSEAAQPLMIAAFSAMHHILYSLIGNANRAALHRFICEDIIDSPSPFNFQPSHPSSSVDDEIPALASAPVIQGAVDRPSTPELVIYGGSGVNGSPFDTIGPQEVVITVPDTPILAPRNGPGSSEETAIDLVSPSPSPAPRHTGSNTFASLMSQDEPAQVNDDVFSSPPMTSIPVLHPSAAPASVRRNATPGPSAPARRNATPIIAPVHVIANSSHPSIDDTPSRRTGRYFVQPGRRSPVSRDSPFPVLRYQSPDRIHSEAMVHSRHSSVPSDIPRPCSPTASDLLRDAEMNSDARSFAAEEEWVSSGYYYASGLRTPPPSPTILMLGEDDRHGSQWLLADRSVIEDIRAFDADVDAAFESSQDDFLIDGDLDMKTIFVNGNVDDLPGN